MANSKNIIILVIIGLLTSCVSKEKSDSIKYRNSIAAEIYTLQNEYDILVKEEKFPSNAFDLYNYIDSLTTLILLEYNLDYSTIKYWNKIDSLTSMQKATNFLVGFDTGFINKEFNAYELENKLTNFLEINNKEIDVGIIFPTFGNKAFSEQTRQGQRTFWMYSKFYHVTLGDAIIELISIKVKIAQIEKLKRT